MPGEVGGAQIAYGAEHRAQMQDRSPRQREPMSPLRLCFSCRKSSGLGVSQTGSLKWPNGLGGPRGASGGTKGGGNSGSGSPGLGVAVTEPLLLDRTAHRNV